MNKEALSTRQRLLEEIEQLARRAIHGTLSESYRTCGNPRCRCHAQGPKHGPHLYISYRGESGKTTGYYVPKAAESEVRRGVEAWSQLQTQLRQLSVLNKERALRSRSRQKIDALLQQALARRRPSFLVVPTENGEIPAGKRKGSAHNQTRPSAVSMFRSRPVSTDVPACR